MADADMRLDRELSQFAVGALTGGETVLEQRQ
jgi:hypothetical protein